MRTADARHDAPEEAGYRDPVIDACKAGIDRTLLRENLKLTVEQRLEQLRRLQAFAVELRRAGRLVRSR
jgi:hypothetical protein